MERFIYIADLLGTVVFAITGAVSGVKLKLDLLGVVVFGCTVGVGGGILRDTIIGATPVAVLGDENYLLACIITGLTVFFIAGKLNDHDRIIRVCDAFGLGIFTALGVNKAVLFGLGPVGIVLCGVLSAVGGGMLRDVMARKVPDILVSDFYATASLLGGVFFLLLRGFITGGWLAFLLVSALVTAIRLLAMALHLQLPSANQCSGNSEKSAR